MADFQQQLSQRPQRLKSRQCELALEYLELVQEFPPVPESHPRRSNGE